jgi:hypothetical protein
MRLHHLARRLMQNQIGEVELNDAMQTRRKIAEKLIELAMRSDRFRNFQKGLILAVQKLRLLSLKPIVFHALRVYADRRSIKTAGDQWLDNDGLIWRCFFSGISRCQRRLARRFQPQLK